MSMGALYDTHEQHREVERRLREMRAAAEEARLARKMKQTSGVRRSIGEFLIATGQVLASRSSEPGVDLPVKPAYLAVHDRS